MTKKRKIRAIDGVRITVEYFSILSDVPIEQVQEMDFIEMLSSIRLFLESLEYIHHEQNGVIDAGDLEWWDK